MERAAGDPGPGDPEARFRSLFEQSPMGIHVYRLDAADRLVFQGGNRAADRILGLAHSPLVGLLLVEAFPGLVGTDLPARYRAIASGAAPWKTEQLEYQDGQVSGAFEVHAFQLAPGEMAAVFQDITRRKRAEEALRISEEQYRILVDAQEDLVVKANLAGWYSYVSPSFCRFFGLTEATVKARPLFELIHPDDRATVAEAILSAAREGRPGDVEHRAATPRGERRLAWKGKIVRDEAGQPAAFVATGRDVTEQREIEERLRQSEKLQAIGQLAGGVAHDFNNQLVGILSSAELLREALPPGEERELAETVAAAARRSADLTRQLLAFARKGPVSRATVDVRKVLADVAALLRHTIDKRIALESRSPAQELRVHGDAAQLHHAILNLALNARDAMPEGGVLRLEAATVPAEGPGRSGLPHDLPAGELVSIAVSDTGVGIAPEVRPHLFEPFFTTKERGRGSGLGLAAVYGTVQAHEGAIDVQSAPGRGTTFTLWLPAEVADRASPARAEPYARTTPRRFLVIDDEPLVRSALHRLLRFAGHEVLLAAGGRAGLEVHARERGRIDGVFLDLMMPDLSGAEVFERLRAVEPGLPVFLASGYALDSPATRLGTAEGVQVLQKPFSLEDLLRAIAAAFPA